MIAPGLESKSSRLSADNSLALSDSAKLVQSLRGAAHLKIWDTPPPNFGAVASTFVDAAYTMSTCLATTT